MESVNGRLALGKNLQEESAESACNHKPRMAAACSEKAGGLGRSLCPLSALERLKLGTWEKRVFSLNANGSSAIPLAREIVWYFPDGRVTLCHG